MKRNDIAKWRPASLGARANAANPANGATDIGLSLMAVMSVAGVWSSISPSYATYASFFSSTEKERAIANKTLIISLAASTLTSLGILLVFKRWTPAIIGQVAALALFGLGTHAVNSPALGTSAASETSTMSEKRTEQVSQRSTQAAPQVQLTRVA